MDGNSGLVKRGGWMPDRSRDVLLRGNRHSLTLLLRRALSIFLMS